MIDLLAPIFRHACPESNNELVNLPRALTRDINIQYYVTMDILQSIVTHRPTHFRYNLDFLSPRDEELLNSEGGPGFKLRWLYGIPDRLVVTLAKINTLWEDFGNHVDLDKTKEIESEIEACSLTTCLTTELNSKQILGKAMAHESWKLAAYIYLYMVKYFSRPQ
jgi:hypothetical protein